MKDNRSQTAVMYDNAMESIAYVEAFLSGMLIGLHESHKQTHSIQRAIVELDQASRALQFAYTNENSGKQNKKP